MVSDKTIHKAFKIHKTLYTKTIREFFISIFTIYQNFTLTLMKGPFVYVYNLYLYVIFCIFKYEVKEEFLAIFKLTWTYM